MGRFALCHDEAVIDGLVAADDEIGPDAPGSQLDMAPPGAPWWIGILYFPIEIVSHCARVMSLSLRLFGNIFGEEMVILILFTLIPFLVPLPMMFLGLITGALQAFIFVLLSIIYLQGAVAVEHHEDKHGHDAPSGRQAPAAA